jgi:hypothetical protein
VALVCWQSVPLEVIITAHLPSHHQTVHHQYHTVALLAKVVHSLALMPRSWQTLSERHCGSLIS